MRDILVAEQRNFLDMSEVDISIDNLIAGELPSNVDRIDFNKDRRLSNNADGNNENSLTIIRNDTSLHNEEHAQNDMSNIKDEKFSTNGESSVGGENIIPIPTSDHQHRITVRTDITNSPVKPNFALGSTLGLNLPFHEGNNCHVMGPPPSCSPDTPLTVDTSSLTHIATHMILSPTTIPSSTAGSPDISPPKCSSSPTTTYLSPPPSSLHAVPALIPAPMHLLSARTYSPVSLPPPFIAVPADVKVKEETVSPTNCPLCRSYQCYHTNPPPSVPPRPPPPMPPSHSPAQAFLTPTIYARQGPKTQEQSSSFLKFDHVNRPSSVERPRNPAPPLVNNRCPPSPPPRTIIFSPSPEIPERPPPPHPPLSPLIIKSERQTPVQQCCCTRNECNRSVSRSGCSSVSRNGCSSVPRERNVSNSQNLIHGSSNLQQIHGNTAPPNMWYFPSTNNVQPQHGSSANYNGNGVSNNIPIHPTSRYDMGNNNNFRRMKRECITPGNAYCKSNRDTLSVGINTSTPHFMNQGTSTILDHGNSNIPSSNRNSTHSARPTMPSGTVSDTLISELERLNTLEGILLRDLQDMDQKTLEIARQRTLLTKQLLDVQEDRVHCTSVIMREEKRSARYRHGRRSVPVLRSVDPTNCHDVIYPSTSSQRNESRINGSSSKNVQDKLEASLNEEISRAQCLSTSNISSPVKVNSLILSDTDESCPSKIEVKLDEEVICEPSDLLLDKEVERATCENEDISEDTENVSFTSCKEEFVDPECPGSLEQNSKNSPKSRNSSGSEHSYSLRSRGPLAGRKRTRSFSTCEGNSFSDGPDVRPCHKEDLQTSLPIYSAHSDVESVTECMSEESFGEAVNPSIISDITRTSSTTLHPSRSTFRFKRSKRRIRKPGLLFTKRRKQVSNKSNKLFVSKETVHFLPARSIAKFQDNNNEFAESSNRECSPSKKLRRVCNNKAVLEEQTSSRIILPSRRPESISHIEVSICFFL